MRVKKDFIGKMAVLYSRVSSREQEQEGYSLDAQKKLLLDYAVKNGFKIARQFSESESARSKGRTKFREMIDFLRSSSGQKENSCKIILVEKTDRVTRNFYDLGSLEVLMKEHDIEIHLVKEGQVLSKKSKSTENFMFAIKTSVARLYSDNLSEECKKGMTEKANQGHYPSLAPIGYRNVRNGDKSVLEIDLSASEYVRKFFDWYSTGKHSLKQIKNRAQSEGFRHPRTGAVVQVNQIHRMLRNPIYHGAFEWDGVVYEGRHDPIISKELFDLVQARFAQMGSRRPRAKRHSWAFSGLVKCGHCGSSMTAEIKKGKYVYYHCSFSKQKCKGTYVREEELDKAFLQSLSALQIQKHTLDWILEIFRISQRDKREFHSAATTDLSQRLALIQKRLDVSYEDLLDGKIDSATFDRISKKWREEQADIEKRLSGFNHADQAYMEGASKLIELAQNCVNTYESQPLEEKRKLLDFVVSNSAWTNGELKVDFKKPFDLLAVTIEKDSEELEKFQPGEQETRRAEKWLGC